jgi:hypothetical protein
VKICRIDRLIALGAAPFDRERLKNWAYRAAQNAFISPFLRRFPAAKRGYLPQLTAAASRARELPFL